MRTVEKRKRGAFPPYPGRPLALPVTFFTKSELKERFIDYDEGANCRVGLGRNDKEVAMIDGTKKSGKV